MRVVFSCLQSKRLIFIRVLPQRLYFINSPDLCHVETALGFSEFKTFGNVTPSYKSIYFLGVAKGKCGLIRPTAKKKGF